MICIYSASCYKCDSSSSSSSSCRSVFLLWAAIDIDWLLIWSIALGWAYPVTCGLRVGSGIAAWYAAADVFRESLSLVIAELRLCSTSGAIGRDAGSNCQQLFMIEYTLLGQPGGCARNTLRRTLRSTSMSFSTSSQGVAPNVKISARK